jgi:hypothetical protein
MKRFHFWTCHDLAQGILSLALQNISKKNLKKKSPLKNHSDETNPSL